ncbi:MAG: hypothetical protein H6836_04925 [Planctomycetes bacterium]|nr:hypothetical protein [Planctomycetota bacterium]
MSSHDLTPLWLVLALSTSISSLSAQDTPRIASQDRAGEPALTVHEWGTFTVLQDERGDALPGVNINEETLPRFVHRLHADLTPDSHELAPVLNLGTHARYASKGVERGCPAARMRLETPVLYFYPRGEIAPLDVHVEFFRGWISEWYPDATCIAPGFDKHDRPHTIPADRSGSLTWKAVRLGGNAAPPTTTSKVWLAPRITGPASVTTPAGQTERYLFYRGVADLPAPLRVVRSADGKSLAIRANQRALPDRAGYRFTALWLADVRADQRVAFRSVPGLTAGADTNAVHATTLAKFHDDEYRAEGRKALRHAMGVELRRAGLFDAEAEAMLDTWEVSYFKSPGLRLFFVLPRNWTDRVLPLRLSQPARVERVMVGRIELVTPEQRDLAARIAAGAKASGPEWFERALAKLPAPQRSVVRSRSSSGEPLAGLGLEVPADYQAYLRIGRFRDAIVLDQMRRQPTPTLRQFVINYQLEYFDPPRRNIAAAEGRGR